MAVQVEVGYLGELQCWAAHGASGQKLLTDAPAGFGGRDSQFSPTDLLAAAMGTCMLTIMGIVARERGLDLEGARASVDKVLTATPPRRVSAMTVRVQLPAHLGPADRKALEEGARNCPVAASFGDQLQLEVQFEYA